MGANVVRVLIVDDEPLQRLNIRTALKQSGLPLQWGADAGDGQEALDWLSGQPIGPEQPPVVVVMDVGLPGVDGVAVTRRIRQRWPQGVHIIMLTSHGDEETFMAAFQAGANGFCLKETPMPLLMTLIEQTAQGACWVDPKLTPVLWRQLQGGGRLPVEWHTAPSQPTETDPGLLRPLGLLTQREMDVLRLLALGKSNQEMASELMVSLNTVKTHLKNVFSKLGVKDRTEAALLAQRTPGL